ncbi:hypothetical protein [Natrononativus amylolyticus]|uniref:hypothetical protein n=1 Tax=Natrononativus amylolyticus TaxID=2963434 RepID=UPI0020CE6ABA|nr:hypothetical protein [Natrononativus amylolyticus]
MSSETEPSVPESMTVETEHWPKDILEKGLWYQQREQEEPPSNYYTVIADKKAVGKKIAEDVDAEEFTSETDFDQSYLLVVQNMMQSARWLELQRINQREEGVDVDVVTESPDEDYADDATVHSLLIRVSDQTEGVPTELNVTIDSNPVDA